MKDRKFRWMDKAEQTGRLVETPHSRKTEMLKEIQQTGMNQGRYSGMHQDMHSGMHLDMHPDRHQGRQWELRS
jgi:hypothetical protein